MINLPIITPSSILNSAYSFFLSPPPLCVSDLLQEFPDILQFDGFTAAPLRHKILHNILTKLGPPVYAKSRCLDPAKHAVTKAEFSMLEKAGIIRYLLLLGPLLYTCSRRRTEVGGRVPITASSIPLGFLTLILFLTLPTSIHVTLVLLFFLIWFCRRGIIRCKLSRRTSIRPPSSPPLGCLSSW